MGTLNRRCCFEINCSDFDSVTLGNGGAFIHQDNLEKEKEEMFKVIGRFMQNKPLWIGENLFFSFLISVKI